MNRRWAIYFPSDLVVVGYDPENADMDRPRGEIIRERYSVIAEDALGFRRVWTGGYTSDIQAEAAYVALAPSVEFWDEITPAYGSEAYARNWREHQAADRRDEMERDGVWQQAA